MEITSSEREHFVVIKWKENRTSFCFFYWAKSSNFFAWDFVNNLDSFYRGYYRFLMFFSNSSGDKYPIEE